MKIYNIRYVALSMMLMLSSTMVKAQHIDNTISKADGDTIEKSKDVGATSVIKGGDLESYPDLLLTNALQGKLLGLQIQSEIGGLSNNQPGIYIRGNHSITNNTAIVVIDGVERPVADLISEEIESIEVLKDATAKILFGSRAANGVLYVTTRRGKNAGCQINASAEYGVMQMTRNADYIDSYQYAQLYNEARLNDGYKAKYSSKDIAGYKRSTGAHDLLYPNVDFSEQFLNDLGGYSKMSFDMIGGTDKVKYALVAGYTGGAGFENVEYTSAMDRLTVRGNLDFDVTSFLTMSADAAVRVEMYKSGQLNCAELFSAISTHRPNEYALTLSQDENGVSTSGLEIPMFGGSTLRPMNIYAETMYGGYTDERYTRSQSNLKANLDLGMITKGLSAGAFLSFDNYEYLQIALNKVYPTYDIVSYRNALGEDALRYIKLKNQNVSTTQSRVSTTLNQSLGWNSFVGYKRDFDKHNVSARLTHQFNNITNQGIAQNLKNSNSSFRVNYAFDNRYLFEGSAALMGSNRYAEGNRLFLSHAVGAAWVMSNESFMQGADFIDLLKFKASTGILGYDSATSHLLHESGWLQNANFRFGETNNGSTAHITNFKQIGNPNIKWETSQELNVGIEAMLFNNRLYSEVNYFRENRQNIVGEVSNMYGSYIGDFSYVDNMGSVFNKGVEAAISWSDSYGDFSYTIGANAVWSENKLTAWNEVMSGDTYRYALGRPTDTMFGLVSQGLFGKDVDINQHTHQSFGSYQEGDIAYLDVNNDNVVDGRDVIALGNSFPRTTMGLELNLIYKNWGLYIQGYSELGVNAWKNNSYYWCDGEDKYSVQTLDRYHPTSNPDGEYPRLSSEDNPNNFRNSSFWLNDVDFFRLKNLELSYTFDKFAKKSWANSLKVFARATNLFVLSSEKDLDPEVLGAGVTNYPMTRNMTVGVAVGF